jgi:hypothetical protein
MWRLGVVFVWVLQRLGWGSPESVSLFSEPTRRLLREADEIEVFSLGGADAGSGPFHNAPVLGSIVVASKRLQRRLISRILIANRYNMGGFLCLGAEYGVRIQAGEKRLDLTFCFDCGRVWVHGTDGYHDSGSIAAYPVSLLKRVLTEAGVPLPPPQHH